MFATIPGESLVVALDLDQFGEVAEKMGWPRYRPNAVTGTVTQFCLELLRKFFGVHIYGIDERQGTEECMLVFPNATIDALLNDLEVLRAEIEQVGRQTGAGSTISIGCAIVPPPVDLTPTQSRRTRDVLSDPGRILARKALKQAKRQGGNRLVQA
ncbi:MAG TPA: hypothetical protein VKK79_23830 [Candidatus Lokiarchaeia archaeon]|nr:hypothetical protein [Candidatus Lokiarchaeia archaeon]